MRSSAGSGAIASSDQSETGSKGSDFTPGSLTILLMSAVYYNGPALSSLNMKIHFWLPTSTCSINSPHLLEFAAPATALCGSTWPTRRRWPLSTTLASELSRRHYSRSRSDARPENSTNTASSHSRSAPTRPRPSWYHLRRLTVSRSPLSRLWPQNP